MNEIGNLAIEWVQGQFGDSVTGTEYTGLLNSSSGWFQTNMGLLNVSIGSSYSGENPSFGLEEAAIYKSLYDERYFMQQSRDAIRGVSASAMQWLQMREGDSTITRLNNNEVARTFRGLARDAKENTSKLITQYRLFTAIPQQVVVEVNAPSGYY